MEWLLSAEIPGPNARDLEKNGHEALGSTRQEQEQANNDSIIGTGANHFSWGGGESFYNQPH